jgi:hypothetical protein
VGILAFDGSRRACLGTKTIACVSRRVVGRENLPNTVDYLARLRNCERDGGTVRCLTAKLPPFGNTATLLGRQYTGSRAPLKILKYRSGNEDCRSRQIQSG